jgi:hypothetical protein
MAMRMASVRVAMPEASSSAPGALVAQLAPTIESWWPPSTTTSPGNVVPWMVRITEG